ncbi:MAG: HNH endonuclease [Terriglobia bacterium]
MPYITIGNLLTFAPNIGVMVNREAVASSPEELFEAVQIAYSHMDDEHLSNACCGGSGPLAGLGEISYETYLKLLESIHIQEAARTAKKAHTKIRRADFSTRRSMLVLAMIDAGTPYVCALEGCGEHQSLTVDHLVPLSRGGTDDLSNLRFLCRAHNSAKGDRKNT